MSSNGSKLVPIGQNGPTLQNVDLSATLLKPDFDKTNSMNSAKVNLKKKIFAKFVIFSAKLGSLNMQNRNNFKKSYS